MSGSHRGGGDRGTGGAGEDPRRPGRDPRRHPAPGDRTYRTETGPHHPGTYRPGSGGHPRGHQPGGRRAARARRRRNGWRWAVILGSVGAGVGICLLAVFAVLTGVGSGGDPGGGRAVGSATESGPSPYGERTAVPDSCASVAQGLVDRLAPGAERTEADRNEGDDRQSQCVWGAYTGDARRQLIIELRAIPGTGNRTPTEAARATFTSERTADETGKAVLTGQEITDQNRLTGVGDDAYVVYSVDKGQGSGEAVSNVLLGNVLITIHYSGSDDGEPLPSQTAKGGAVDVAKAVIQGMDRP
ncbi:hypothetical protein E1264_02055 [Actinomadura sp. KC216]|uniref:hypothetical protein n=1 Tax=Actinomadura sp. KC216 TaxID=2530370 RepID=UPI0010512881|nr:hypothetical protein [Actinomadura sp. KC216]TDB91279.1 hypothetical protein E1264_02055 [Actinomadura sp. KC216]